MKVNVFVYGTLMKGQRAEHLLGPNRVLKGDAVLEGYDVYDLGYYPAIAHGSGRAYGEVWEIEERSLRTLDHYEGEGDLYLREKVPVKVGNDEVEAYVYVFKDVDGMRTFNYPVINHKWVSNRNW